MMKIALSGLAQPAQNPVPDPVFPSAGDATIAGMMSRSSVGEFGDTMQRLLNKAIKLVCVIFSFVELKKKKIQIQIFNNISILLFDTSINHR